MNTWHKEHAFAGRLVMVGLGCIGRGVLPLLFRHIDMLPRQVVVLNTSDAGAEVAHHFGVRHLREPLSAGNLARVLEPLLGPGDFLLNLSVDVSSAALIAFCQARGVLYLDTCIEPWPGGYNDPGTAVAERTNYALREATLALRQPGGGGPTAVLTHGANPGLVSHFLKQALLDVAQATGAQVLPPTDREAWARLAQSLCVRTIHIAERDTQIGEQRKAMGEFVNTWSVHGFVSEGCQPAELGWGSQKGVFRPMAGGTALARSPPST